VGTQRRDELVMSRGVTIRRHESGEESIQVAFSYRGQQCRETLRGRKPTKTNVEYASRLLGKINLEIENGEFEYSKTFPRSKRAALFAQVGDSQTIEQLMKLYAKSQ